MDTENTEHIAKQQLLYMKVMIMRSSKTCSFSNIISKVDVTKCFGRCFMEDCFAMVHAHSRKHCLKMVSPSQCHAKCYSPSGLFEAVFESDVWSGQKIFVHKNCYDQSAQMGVGARTLGNFA